MTKIEKLEADYKEVEASKEMRADDKANTLASIQAKIDKETAKKTKEQKADTTPKPPKETPPKPVKETPPKESKETKKEKAEAQELSYLNPKTYEECLESVKMLSTLRKANKVAKLKETALKEAKTTAEKKAILAKNSVQDFATTKTKRIQDTVKQMLDYAEKQRVITLQNNPNDTEKEIFFRKHKGMLDTAQTKVAVEVEKAVERFTVELHKRFEQGEDLTKIDFVVLISF